jgi:hypothetical protein
MLTLTIADSEAPRTDRRDGNDSLGRFPGQFASGGAWGLRLLEGAVLGPAKAERGLATRVFKFVDIDAARDTAVLFPSWFPHEVLPVSLPRQ